MGLKFECLHENVIKDLGNALGNFIRFDKEAINRGFGDYVRVLVEVESLENLETKIRVKTPKGDIWVEAWYEDLCVNCGTVGHTKSVCRKSVKKDHLLVKTIARRSNMFGRNKKDNKKNLTPYAPKSLEPEDVITTERNQTTKDHVTEQALVSNAENSDTTVTNHSGTPATGIGQEGLQQDVTPTRTIGCRSLLTIDSTPDWSIPGMSPPITCTILEPRDWANDVNCYTLKKPPDPQH